MKLLVHNGGWRTAALEYGDWLRSVGVGAWYPVPFAIDPFFNTSRCIIYIHVHVSLQSVFLIRTIEWFIILE